ncbi:hypothetical protein AGABI2DRAFT_67159, partial [Agaricus bisporus var. bisporus H97]|uniref:hypothetical protein n=1 Tax=Agaricus bisporus var. bisporus (strain H97 / ATCC MYA-4626 / FGSC 10389) TaxID=936046 RepID=UPI00029F5B92
IIYSGAFNRWAPKLYERYRDALNLVVSRPEFSHIRRISKKSVFASHCLNTGSSVVTMPHRDSMNLAHGWCAIVALGHFDHVMGGHLVLHELKLIIQFPAGSAALIPSAAITHSNVMLKPGDKRASITFYTRGGLFRFVDNDFKMQGSMGAGEEKGRQAAREIAGPSTSIQFSRLDELAQAP